MSCSRAAHRDWLRHDEKVRDAVRDNLPEIVAGADVINEAARTVRVPVRMLEHYHFRLRRPEEQRRRGAGRARSPATCSQSRIAKRKGEKGQGGRDEGEVQLLLEFKIDDIVDWLWEEMQLPNLKARVGPSDETDWVREGWDKRGARSRLDRRRSFKEMVKRRSQPGRHADASPTKICASASSRAASSRQCTRWCSSCWTCPAACPTGIASSRRASSSGWCRACGASIARSRRCSSRTPPKRGSSPSRSSSR